ncbi:hypothetical protein [Fibrella aquatilis]|uniref:Uncharacterized protein n=1 Tax=Fibrella aquatilis TaxID=2817059 RepID=A0A939G2D0_9BACT|nr:hypothetical protein [Fibrella aquatilis]MBO0929810.1 hypothetical protein [Fibrella aquatilis]
MNEPSERDKAIERMEENGRHQSGSHDDVYKQEGKKALMVDNDGFVKEIGEGSWRRYDARDDQ